MEFAGLAEIHKTVLAKRHELFFAIEAITPTPQLRSSGIDQKKQAITPRDTGFYLLDLFLRQCRAGRRD
jgi:hypothetical protein